MPSGVYERKLPPTFLGFERVGQVSNGSGGSEAVVIAHCAVCMCPVERTAKAVKLAKRDGRWFTCRTCVGKRLGAANKGRTRAKKG
jgi:hypothetical protein